jgi:hypothetical protein
MAGLLPAMLKAELMNLGFLPPVFESNDKLYQCVPCFLCPCHSCVCDASLGDDGYTARLIF